MCFCDWVTLGREQGMKEEMRGLNFSIRVRSSLFNSLPEGRQPQENSNARSLRINKLFTFVSNPELYHFNSYWGGERMRIDGIEEKEKSRHECLRGEKMKRSQDGLVSILKEGLISEVTLFILLRVVRVADTWGLASTDNKSARAGNKMTQKEDGNKSVNTISLHKFMILQEKRFFRLWIHETWLNDKKDAKVGNDDN